MKTAQRVLEALAERGLLLEQDKELPNVEPSLRANSHSLWWSHPRARLIFATLAELARHPDVLFTRNSCTAKSRSCTGGSAFFPRGSLRSRGMAGAWSATLGPFTASTPGAHGLSPRRRARCQGARTDSDDAGCASARHGLRAASCSGRFTPQPPCEWLAMIARSPPR